MLTINPRETKTETLFELLSDEIGDKIIDSYKIESPISLDDLARVTIEVKFVDSDALTKFVFYL